MADWTDPDNEEQAEDVALDSRMLLSDRSAICGRCGKPYGKHPVALGKPVCGDGLLATATVRFDPEMETGADWARRYLHPQDEVDQANEEGSRLRLNAHAASFADAPTTIGEARAQRDQSAAKWSPRDLLISLLREIDSGETKISALVVSYAVEHDDGALSHGYRNACPDNFTALGLLARAGHRLQE